jgi:DNA-directed RNA polymerase specialized sigma24 family protein
MTALKHKHVGYATAEDFCSVFHQHLDDLYQLAFLLTADHERAESCLVRGLEDSIQVNGVFKEWAHAWAKRAIIKNAILAFEPRAASDPSPAQINFCAHRNKSQSPTRIQGGRIEVNQIFALDDFERFAFVMSVLERYPDQECALLLGCSDRQVRQARVNAIANFANPADTARDVAQSPAATRSRMNHAPVRN